jgi:hypothetical protein
MKGIIATIVIALALTGSALAKKKDSLDNLIIPQGACLAVTPGGTACYSWFTKSTSGDCYSYLESANLPMRAVKGWYGKKDLETLEDRGVKIVMTTKESYRVKGKDSVQVPTDDSKTAGAVDLTHSLDAGCSK